MRISTRTIDRLSLDEAELKPCFSDGNEGIRSIHAPRRSPRSQGKDAAFETQVNLQSKRSWNMKENNEIQIDKAETIQDIVLRSYRQMSPNIWDHVSGGTESETTLRRNRQALDRIAFRPRVLRDVSEIDPSTTFLGCKLPIPVFLAPIGGLDQFYPSGAFNALGAATQFGIPMFLSSVGQLELEEADEVADRNLVFQLYIQGDHAWTEAFLERVAASNCCAFCLTVDIAMYSRRERDLYNLYAPPGRRAGPRDAFEHQAAMTWDLLDRIRSQLDMPVIVKGIATAEDARLAVEHGVDVVYVSNHGGRQLDHGLGSMEVLPEVLEAVDGKSEVVVDSGFVRGTDILKAIAMGARAVGLGKLQVWALAAGGQDGVRRMLEILENEITVSMGLLGVTRLNELNPSYLHHATPVNYPGEFSPFPSLERLKLG
jgi:glycolate oxidase